MNFKKTVAIATAVGALAAISVPAMAMENEFHGMYRLRAMMSNFENAGGGTLAKDAPTMTVFEQRARLQYTAKASDDLKLVTHFEIDSSWGDAAYANGRGTGGGMAADTVNLETKNVYLDFNCPLTGANVKVGIQGVNDAYKGVFFTDDMAGIFASKKFGMVTATAGFSRLYDYAGASAIGRSTDDLYLLDAKFNLSKNLTLGGSYYLVRNDVTAAPVTVPVTTPYKKTQDVHMLGVNAAANFGIVSADAFLAYQGGKEIAVTDRDLSAFAGLVAVKANLAAAGTLRGAVLYTSGDDGKSTSKSTAWQSLNSSSGVNTAKNVSSNSYYDANMLLLMRSKWNMDSDKALVNTTNNNNHGLTLLALGYDLKFTDKLSVSANAGYAMYSQKGTATDSAIGTEINAQLDYKMFANLTTSVQVAYVILGDAVKTVAGKTADNPYLTAVMMNYSF